MRQVWAAIRRGVSAWPHPTPRGWVLSSAAFVLVGVSVALHSTALALVAAWFALMSIGTGVLLGLRVIGESRPSSRMGLQVARRAEPDILPYGHKARVTLAVSASRWAATPQVHEQVARALLPVTPGQGCYEVTGSQRGVWRLGPLTAARSDPLGLWTRHFSLGPATAVMVWPQVATFDHHPFAGWSPEPGPPARHGPLRARLDDMTLREYRPGDELRRIHWRASARRGELVVRASEPSHPFSLTIALVLPHAGRTTMGAAEWLISAAATAAHAAIGAHAKVRLVCGGQLDASSQPTMLSALARVEVPQTPDAARQLAGSTAHALGPALRAAPDGGCLVLTGLPLTDELAAAAGRFEPRWLVACGLTSPQDMRPGLHRFGPADDVGAALTAVMGVAPRRRT